MSTIVLNAEGKWKKNDHFFNEKANVKNLSKAIMKDCIPQKTQNRFKREQENQ